MDKIVTIATNADKAALGVALTTAINDLNSIIGLTPPLTNTQRDNAIQKIAQIEKLLLKRLVQLS